ncbi:MAG: M81 family metallopeptidase [Phycisphaerae bacterium]
MKWLVAEFVHETNTFSTIHPGRDEFAAVILHEGLAIPRFYGGTRTCVGGFMDFAARHGVELIWTVAAHTTPAGPIQAEFYQWVKSRILDGLGQKVDGVLLALHGAMVAEGVDDGEGDVLEAIRGRVGPAVPIATTLDFHTNMSRRMVDCADILVGYKTYPHVDLHECGTKAAELLLAAVRGGVHPARSLQCPPLLPPLGNTSTFKEPMRSVMARAAQIERRPGVLSASVFGSFPYADIADAGMSVLVITDGRQADGDAHAKELSDLLWSRRREFLHKAVPIGEAVRRAMQSPRGPVVLADVADNPGGGGATDGVEIMRELLKQNAQGAAVGPTWDPAAVRECERAGVGGRVAVDVGGKTDGRHGGPVRLEGTVTYLGGGEYTYKGPMATGMRMTMGRCAIIRCGGVDALISSRRVQNLDPEIFRSVGVEPARCRIVVVKSSIHFRAAYQPIAAEIIEVDAPGIVSPDLRQFDFRNLRRPVFPLDDM